MSRHHNKRDSNEAQAVRELRGLGFKVMKITGDIPGTPDLIICKHGRVCLCEWKTKQGRLTADQVLWHDELKAAGVDVLIARSIEDVLQWFGEI